MSATRRQFLKAGAAGSAALLVEVPLFAKLRNGAAFAPNPWVSIGRDGKITLVIGHSEMGQGVRTSLAMILAEELEADWKTVTIRQASPGPDYKGLSTGGSDSVEDSWMPLRKAGAAARVMLVEAAAKTWKVPAAECAARDGAVHHASSGRSLAYGSLVAAAAAFPVPAEPPLKDRRDFRLVGTRVRRVDGPEIVSGTATYGIDVRRPGMLFAAVARPPVAGGRVVRFDAAKAKAVPDVLQVVEISTGIAVIARHTHAAFAGREALQAVFEPGPNAGLTSAELDRRLDDPTAVSNKALHRTRAQGDAAAALGAAATRLSAVYRDAFQAHASVEPQNCTAAVSSAGPRKRCEIWAPTQHPERVRDECAKLLGFPVESVTVNVTLLGGGFGRRLGADYATEAVEVARAVGAGKPVQVVWSREDDFLGDYFHPAERVELEAGLDASGRITGWRHSSRCWHLSMFGGFDPADSPTDVSPWGGYDLPYAIENVAAEYTEIESPLRTGAWRAVYYPPNVFARESFLDEIAARLGRDPLELRLSLLDGQVFTLPNGRWKIDRPRLAAVLRLAGEKSDWSSKVTAPPGRRAGRGVACNVYHARTVIAQVAEVSVGSGGDVRVHRLVTAVDCGQIVNRSGIESQVESGVAWGLTYALKGEITIAGGRAAETSYGEYPVLAMAEMPVVETHVVDSDRPPTGLGEQPVPAVAPAVANAIFAATGKRLRRIPIRPADLA
jgi:isoquinoline 1-oxidoreductase beta subunit